MRRRDFITLLGGAAASPLAARAQQPDRMQQIGVLLNVAASDPEARVAIAAFREGLQQLGWAEGRNVRIDVRWGEDDLERERRYAVELVALAPDVLPAAGSVSLAALQHATRAIPIVFVGVVDPVGAGFVDALARPGGNTTGFMLFEYSFSGKWLELLKQLAPSVTRVAVLRDVSNPSSSGEFVAIQSVGHLLGVEVRPINVGDSGEIERAVAAFARSANGALIVTGSAAVSIHRDLVIALAARHRLPAVYARRSNVSTTTSSVPAATQRRRATRQRILKPGTISFGAGGGISCGVRDYSEIGANLEVVSSAGIPRMCVLKIEGQSAMRDCVVVWTKQTRIGVQFV